VLTLCGIHTIRIRIRGIRQLWAKNKAKWRPNASLTIWVLAEPVRYRTEVTCIAMPLHVERINWMPSPPLAPDNGPIDVEHLRRMTLGDAALEREVLAMFSSQAIHLVGTIASLPKDAGALAHKLKGSARAIGAFEVADAAGRLESHIANGSDPSRTLTELKDAVELARSAASDILRRS
jgi:HPt (histidine-containing phosphotransfer) domain-containing protein